MNDHEFAHRVRNFQRQARRLEGLLLEQLGSLESMALGRLRFLDLLEKANAELDEREALAKRVLAADPAQRAACEKTLRMVVQRRTHYANADRESRRRLQRGQRLTRANLAKYQDLLATVEDVRTTRGQIQEEERQQESGGLGLLGSLGAALFAWRASNAFDNLDKIAKGK